LLASLTLVGFGSLALKPLEQQFPYLLHVSGFDYLRAALLLLAAGCFLAWLASYASTRRSMDA
jgi:cell division protein FtsX